MSSFLSCQIPTIAKYTNQYINCLFVHKYMVKVQKSSHISNLMIAMEITKTIRWWSCQCGPTIWSPANKTQSNNVHILLITGKSLGLCPIIHLNNTTMNLCTTLDEVFYHNVHHSKVNWPARGSHPDSGSCQELFYFFMWQGDKNLDHVLSAGYENKFYIIHLLWPTCDECIETASMFTLTSGLPHWMMLRVKSLRCCSFYSLYFALLPTSIDEECILFVSGINTIWW